MPNDIEWCEDCGIPWHKGFNNTPNHERGWMRPVGGHLLRLRDCDSDRHHYARREGYDTDEGCPSCDGSGRVIDAEVHLDDHLPKHTDTYDRPFIVIPLEGGDE